MTGGPGKEQGTNKPPSTGRVQERWKGDTICPTTSQNPFHWHPSWLNKACTTRKDSESEWLAKDNPEPNPITIKAKSCSPGFPHPTALHLGAPFPIKSLALSAHVSPWTIHFWVLDKSPLSGPLPSTILSDISLLHSYRHMSLTPPTLPSFFTNVDIKSRHDLKVESYFIQWEFLGLQAQEAASQVALRKQLWGGGAWSPVI